MSRNDFAVFILTFGRADNVITYKTLRSVGYTGKIYFIVSDDDIQQEKYIKNFGKDNVFIFNKEEIEKTFDIGDNFKDKKKVIIYARNYSIQLAKELGLKYMLQLDDDYSTFDYTLDSKNNYKRSSIKSFDKVIDVFIEYLESSQADSIAFVQGGDLIGGQENELLNEVKMKRKAMNTFFINLSKPFSFIGRINEDVNTYVSNGIIGKLFLTLPQIVINQKTTQTNKNGMTETYIDGGTYLKTFYTVMYAPSCVKISTMGEKHKRIHHSISWNNCVPCIISEEYKKG